MSQRRDGGVWLNAAVSKTVVRVSAVPGFESLPLRHMQAKRSPVASEKEGGATLISGKLQAFCNPSKPVILDDEGSPRGFPHELLDETHLGSMTIWPGEESFVWWQEA